MCADPYDHPGIAEAPIGSYGGRSARRPPPCGSGADPTSTVLRLRTRTSRPDICSKLRQVFPTERLAKVACPRQRASRSAVAEQYPAILSGCTVFTMIRNTVTVQRTIEEVFDYAAQFDRHPEVAGRLEECDR